MAKKNKPSVVILKKTDLDRCFYADLSPIAFRTLIEIIKRYNGNNNGKLIITHPQVKHIKGFSGNKTLKKALIELQDKNWIEKTKQGGLYKNASRYKIKEENFKLY